MVKELVRQGRRELRGSPYETEYGEPLSKARTPPDSFSNILLEGNTKAQLKLVRREPLPKLTS